MTSELLEKIKKTVIATSPFITAVCAIWGLDVASIVSATEVFLIACLQYVQFWIDYKNGK